MRTANTQWPFQEAKARFSELLDTCLAQGPQTISRRGVPEAVIVPLPQWQQLTTTRHMSLKELLLDQNGRFTIDLPQRGQGLHRSIKED